MAPTLTFVNIWLPSASSSILFSLPYTNATCKRSPRLLCPRQPCCLGHTAPLTASAVGNRSLMWAYHITRQLPPHSLTAEAEGGYLCCSRTSAMPTSSSQRTSRTTWCNGLPTTPTAAYLAAEGISPTTGPRKEGKKDAQDLSLCDRAWCVQ